MRSATFDILVIEDEPETIVGTVSDLELLGYTIDMAGDCARAKTLLARNAYSLLLVDLRLPARSGRRVIDDGGLDLVIRLRRGEFGTKNKDAPYVVISAQEFYLDRLEKRYTDPEVIRLLHEGRVLRYQKGCMMRAIVTCVSEVLGARQ